MGYTSDEKLLIAQFLKYFFELSHDLKTSPLYTMGGKGWGGAQYHDGYPVGLDCSGLVTGLFSRLGLISHNHRDYWSAQGTYNATKEIQEGEIKPFDLIYYGSSKKSVSHVSIVCVPHKIVFEAAGGGRKTHPPGSYHERAVEWWDAPAPDDWPPKNGRVRFTHWDYRTSDRLGYSRIGKESITGEDRDLIEEWESHLKASKQGRQIPLSSSAKKAGYREHYNEYYKNLSFEWRVK